MLLDHEPRIGFPAYVQNKEKRTCKVGLEEGGGVEVGPTNWPESDVELSRQAEEIHDSTDVGSPDPEGCLEGQFIGAVAVKFPTRSQLERRNNSMRWLGTLTKRTGNGYGR